VGPTDPSEEYFDKGLWGWDGSVWRKAALPWGYTGVVNQQVIDLNAAAGQNILSGSAVPAGEVWVIEVISVFNNTTACAKVVVDIVSDGQETELLYETTIVVGQRYIFDGRVTLNVGDYINVYFIDCVAGDDLYMRLHGNRMRVS